MAGTGMGGADMRTAALAASVLFHAAVVVLLVRYLSQPAPVAEAPAIQVTLLPRPKPPDDRPRQRRERDRSPPAVAPRAAPPTAAVAPAPFQPAPPQPAPSDAGSDARGRLVLRALAACDPARLDRLSPEDRERCESRQARRVLPRGGRLNLDPSGRYVEDETPYLVRKPKDGCKVRATGDVAPGGDSGHVRAGVGCAVAF